MGMIHINRGFIMKITGLYGLIILTLALGSCCTGREASSVEVQKEEGEMIVSSENKIVIDAKHQNTGKIEVSGDEVYYVLNWTSRSRKTLKVTGPLKKEIGRLAGRIIEAQGAARYESPWRGSILIESYTLKN
jgi:hypothetical protein